MHDENAPSDTSDSDLPAIEFQSPGRFPVHNPAATENPRAHCPAAPFRLGEHARLERFKHSEQARSHILALLQQARHSLCLYSPDLESGLYSHDSVSIACQNLLLTRPQNRLRILLRDSGPALRNGHRLLGLSRRITSNLHIRRINPDLPAPESAFLLVDDRGLLLRERPQQIDGIALYNAPGRVRHYQALFDQAWDASLSDPDLRSFLL